MQSVTTTWLPDIGEPEAAIRLSPSGANHAAMNPAGASALLDQLTTAQGSGWDLAEYLVSS